MPSSSKTTRAFAALGMGALAVYGSRVLLDFFGPSLPYSMPDGCARETIRITTPYFLPDRSARHALAEAVQKRGVAVEILTAGPHIDHPFVRRLSHHSSRQLLEAGAKIYEYQPAMIHAKLMTVDGQWSVAGSTNFDHRSFALNDEVNLAVLDRELAGVLDRDFHEDIGQSRNLTLAMLRERTLLGKEQPFLDHAFEIES